MGRLAPYTARSLVTGCGPRRAVLVPCFRRSPGRNLRRSPGNPGLCSLGTKCRQIRIYAIGSQGSHAKLNSTLLLACVVQAQALEPACVHGGSAASIALAPNAPAKTPGPNLPFEASAAAGASRSGAASTSLTRAGRATPAVHHVPLRHRGTIPVRGIFGNHRSGLLRALHFFCRQSLHAGSSQADVCRATLAAAAVLAKAEDVLLCKLLLTTGATWAVDEGGVAVCPHLHGVLCLAQLSQQRQGQDAEPRHGVSRALAGRLSAILSNASEASRSWRQRESCRESSERSNW